MEVYHREWTIHTHERRQERCNDDKLTIKESFEQDDDDHHQVEQWQSTHSKTHNQIIDSIENAVMSGKKYSKWAAWSWPR